VADPASGEYPLAEPAALPAGSCPSCGGYIRPARADAGQAVNGISLRAAIPQPMAAALLLARTLTPRERAVFQLLGFGYDNRSIARALAISERTVKRYITAILAKLKLESRLQAGLTALIISSSSAAESYWPENWPESHVDLPTATCNTINNCRRRTQQ
jgi:DNA-binding CsgD family transcriptional regulator